MRLTGIVAGAIIGLGAGIGGMRYLTLNGANITLSPYKGHGRVGPSGDHFLRVSKDEQFDIGYAVADWDGLEKITIYKNSEIIDEDTEPGKGRSGVLIGRHFEEPGTYIFKIIGVDKHGNKREDSATLIVE